MWNFQCLSYKNKRTAKYGTETVTYKDPNIEFSNLKSKNVSSCRMFVKEIRKQTDMQNIR